MAHPAILLTGPTTVGKTSVALELAARLDGELVAVDKYHLVDEFSLSTGVADLLRLTSRPPMHLYQTLHPLANLPGPSEYCLLAAKACEGIRARGKTPIIEGCVGGYAKALANYTWGPGLEELCVIGLLPPPDLDVEGRMRKRFDKAVEAGIVEEVGRGLSRGYEDTEIMRTNIVGNLAAHARGEMSLAQAKDIIIAKVLDYTPRDIRKFSKIMHRTTWIEADPERSDETASQIIRIAADRHPQAYAMPARDGAYTPQPFS